jgi:hypothetical protein
MKKSELIAAIQKEILRHEFSTFVDEPPVRQSEFLERIAHDAITPLIERLSQILER